MIMDNIHRSRKREQHKTARHYGKMDIRRHWIEECGVNSAVEGEGWTNSEIENTAVNLATLRDSLPATQVIKTFPALYTT
jgi:hypothetical protein